MTSQRASRLIWPVVVLVLAGAVLVWFLVTKDTEPRLPRSAVVPGVAAPDGWKTVAYRDVQVAVPDAWERVDTSDCEFRWERWAARGSADCEFDGGIAFYGSATFDPATGPGVQKNTWSTDEPAWGGYAEGGDYVVYAADDARQIVQDILSSARVTG